MLINKIGVDDDDIAQLDDRRPAPDPKNRETMTSLLQAAMAPVTRAELMVIPAPSDAAVVALETSNTPSEQSARTDVA